MLAWPVRVTIEGTTRHLADRGLGVLSRIIVSLINVDPAVRSIRIAATLNERFGAIAVPAVATLLDARGWPLQ